MSLKQLEQTLQLSWNRKSAAEKLIAKVLVGLAAIAAGNSGVSGPSALDTPPSSCLGTFGAGRSTGLRLVQASSAAANSQ